MTMVILSPFLSLEGQTSYSIEDKPWPPHSSLLEDGSNDHGHTLYLLKTTKASSYSIEGKSWPPHNPHYWNMGAGGHGPTPSLLVARRADFLLCRG